MEINQAFAILQSAGNIRAARIITESGVKLTRYRVWRMAQQLRHGVPVAKIIHQKWFYGLKFYTNKHTLDPRPDTETLISAVISDCITDTTHNILDLGTGTGCIICSLVKNILENSTDQKIVASVVELGEKLGVKVIAEYVETEEQRDKLKELGCFWYQGYLYSKPVALDEFIVWMKKCNEGV